MCKKLDILKFKINEILVIIFLFLMGVREGK